MDRRQFIRVSGLSAFAVSACGAAVLQQDGSFTGDCATTNDILGPFFRENAPWRQDLTYPGNTVETPLRVFGRVYGADCKSPLQNALVDVWHCDHTGEYDNESEEFRCRGRVRTDTEGRYAFTTFVPPPYGGRPKHIHYLVREADGYQDLVTQLYFQGDDRLANNHWGRFPRDDRRILAVMQERDHLPEVRMDLYLSEV